MGILDFFRRVKTKKPQQVREMLSAPGADELTLLDVRSPKEYAGGHIPGARLIPLNELKDRMDELDAERTTIAYCGHGVRSRAAASMLTRAGFREIWNMKGGIAAWEGEVTKSR